MWLASCSAALLCLIDCVSESGRRIGNCRELSAADVLSRRRSARFGIEFCTR